MKFLIFFFIFLIFNFKFVLSIAPPTNEYNCLKNIVTKYKLSTAFVPDTAGVYPFCSIGSVSCYTNGSISSLRLNWEATTTVSPTASDFSCFPYFTFLQLYQFTISTTLLYSKIQNLNTLVLAGSKGITTINSQLAIYDQFSIYSQDFNSVIKMSYLNGLGYVTLGGGKITLETDSAAVKTTLRTFLFYTMNIPDMTGYTDLQYIQFSLNDGWNTASAANISKIDCVSLSLTFPSTPSISFPKPKSSSRFFYYTISGATLTKPSAIIDLSTYSFLKNIQILNPGPNFHLNNDIPFKLSQGTGLRWVGGSLTKFPTLSQYSSSLEISSSINTPLPDYTGSIKYLVFSNNLITGSVSSSWCNTHLVVTNNKMVGTLPSCIYCYLNDSSVYNDFSGNSFTNLVNNPICTTFAPKISIVKVNNFPYIFVTGTDIGLKPTSYWVFNSTLKCGTWNAVSSSNYSCSIPSLSKVEYFWINFVQPNNKNYTFPAISKQPTPTSIVINSNKATITGTFFSSYLNYVPQSITVGSATCSVTSSSFYEIQCTMTTTPSNTQLVTLNTNSLSKKVYIKTTNALLNNKPCPNDCNGNSRGICDLSTGQCVCNSGFALNDCSGYTCADPTCSNGGTCNQVEGKCVCDPSHQGENCNLNFIQCQINGGKICSGAGTCANQTGICTCNTGRTLADCSGYKCDSQNNCNGNGVCDETKGKCECYNNWQGIDCDTPYKDCVDPTCSNHGICFNQTGTCQCNSSWQGEFCELVFKPCPNNCNNHGLCNDQTGKCSCSPEYQGLECQYPYLPCENDCSGFGLCDNKTSVCTCFEGRLGDSCELIQCKDPQCSENGNCDYSLGVCSCNTPFFGDTCSLSQCSDPNCSGNGQCIYDTGVCGCDNGWKGNICHEPICLTNCSNNGICIQPEKCQCIENRIFDDCSGIQCLDPTCGGNGQCNHDIGICECKIEFTGENCTFSNHYASSVESVGEAGGQVTIYGFFGDEHKDPLIRIGTLECEIVNITHESIICNIGAGTGIKDIFISQNNIDWEGKSLFQYIKDYDQSNECTSACNLNNGKCVNGKCECYTGFKSFDCNSLNDTNIGGGNLVESKPSIDGGSGIIQNGAAQYNILVVSLVEVDIGGKHIIKHNLENNWKLNNKLSNGSFYYFEQQLTDSDTKISTTLEIITNDKVIEFANIKFPIEKNSIKVYVNISNYQYKSTLNTLQLHYKSITSKLEDSSECNQNSKEINIKTNDIENSQEKGSINHQSYVTIENQNKLLYGRFIDRVISNGRPTFATTSIIEKDSKSITISMNLPHCNECLIDPDFSVLISPNFVDSCNNNSKNNYIIPVAVAIPVAGVSAISAASIFFYKRRIKNLEMKNISKKLNELKNK
ncbi:hypothetical protein DICPUDRAFT_82750 [Dictyostelium purpureum]|uniref:EGF-like domain-containing protein n=1 Tax=Dictyostelium purpureum TaxID=5786 RepID=F0ZXG9_DICPU|nr:uncharacterized protein DICPUDRAFT_82750 [Dictyostelium purpureum]EGC31369.1 hypothetical protein DICPUDRAFT_82750 [Dictyostelium purpureum]|eukprot:XP_003292117.1 hypothetical protein DICPUDRAFT_82750 [Dictyostelium purpureum]